MRQAHSHSKPQMQASGRKPTANFYSLCFTVLACVLLGFGGVWLFRSSVDSRHQRAVSSWPQVPATVLNVTQTSYKRCQPSAQCETVSYLEARYQYEVGGKTYTSNQVGYESTTGSVEKLATLERSARSELNATAPAYVDPHDASNAVLDNTYKLSRSHDTLLNVIMLAAGVAAAVAAIAIAVRARRRQRRASAAGDAYVVEMNPL
jgi:Protein of unknown function (DUF3592)